MPADEGGRQHVSNFSTNGRGEISGRFLYTAQQEDAVFIGAALFRFGLSVGHQIKLEIPPSSFSAKANRFRPRSPRRMYLYQ